MFPAEFYQLYATKAIVLDLNSTPINKYAVQRTNFMVSSHNLSQLIFWPHHFKLNKNDTCKTPPMIYGITIF
jgi:hypothetical protein